MPIGAFASGTFIDSFGAPKVLAANGILLVVLSGIFWSTQRRIRQL
jgi:hypothetical protein